MLAKNRRLTALPGVGHLSRKPIGFPIFLPYNDVFPCVARTSNAATQGTSKQMGEMMARHANRIVRSIVAAYAFVSLPMVAALIILVAMTAAFSSKAEAICLNPGCSICKDVCNSARQNHSEVMREIKIKGKDHYDASADLSKFYEERAPECTKRTFDQQLDLQRLLVGAMQPTRWSCHQGRSCSI
ncbi:hypothetical protein [Candidatus Accumulibacter sp. ACC003]|uniref:hypothetical protein n=1 Tax=Candidatus Accumulibacter sp. ACC003 TaxID=2823334 RepID=UPI0025B8C71A|nr:hypothetical protein [Candidatus Accumulibacter sp. ACC003]